MAEKVFTLSELQGLNKNDLIKIAKELHIETKSRSKIELEHDIFAAQNPTAETSFASDADVAAQPQPQQFAQPDIDVPNINPVSPLDLPSQLGMFAGLPPSQIPAAFQLQLELQRLQLQREERQHELEREERQRQLQFDLTKNENKNVRWSCNASV